MNIIRTALRGAVLAAALLAPAIAPAFEKTHYRTLDLDGVNVFYREAGKPEAPTVVLLHGWGASSFMFRDLMPILAEKYHVVAPDLPGFGLTTAPPRGEFRYDFDNLANVMERFLDAKEIDRYAVYIFDYGAPTGLRLALRHPERISAIISQNGNAYIEGLSSGWDPIRRYWNEPTEENRNALRGFMTLETQKFQYLEGVPDPSLVEPEAYLLAQAAFDQPGNMEIQLDLFADYKSNLELYPAFQEYFRNHQPPFLAVWGENDPFFLPVGAEAYRRDNPMAEVYFYETGHFALETHNAEIAGRIMAFLDRVVK